MDAIVEPTRKPRVPTIEIAIECFDGASTEEIARSVATLGQRDLQAKFNAVYDTTTRSNNNEWLRRKLLEAIGVKTNAKTKTSKHGARKGSAGGKVTKRTASKNNLSPRKSSPSKRWTKSPSDSYDDLVTWTPAAPHAPLVVGTTSDSDDSSPSNYMSYSQAGRLHSGHGDRGAMYNTTSNCSPTPFVTSAYATPMLPQGAHYYGVPQPFMNSPSISASNAHCASASTLDRSSSYQSVVVPMSTAASPQQNFTPQGRWNPVSAARAPSSMPPLTRDARPTPHRPHAHNAPLPAPEPAELVPSSFASHASMESLMHPGMANSDLLDSDLLDGDNLQVPDIDELLELPDNQACSMVDAMVGALNGLISKSSTDKYSEIVQDVTRSMTRVGTSMLQWQNEVDNARRNAAY